MCFFHVKIYLTYPHILPYICPPMPPKPPIPPLYPPYTPLYPSPMSTPPPPIPPPIPPQLSNISEFRNGRNTLAIGWYYEVTHALQRYYVCGDN
jgi:hypothetical protein